MAECTNQDLRKARDTAGFPRWKLGEMVGVSESTIERWETGEAKPMPDDVDRIGEAVGDGTLWHRWMLSNYDSYRRRYIGTDDLTLPVSAMRMRHGMGDVSKLQDAFERDAIDGRIDDPTLNARYTRELRAMVASATYLLQQLGKDGSI